MGLRTYEYGTEASILAFTKLRAAIGVQVNDTGVTADTNGKKIIPAGTPIGGATSAKDDETAVLSVVNDSTVQGIVENDVDVTSGKGTATMLIWAFVNEYRLPDDVTISDDVKTALDGKVTFMKRNDL